MSEVLDYRDQGKLGAGSGGSEKGNQNKHLSETAFTVGYIFLGTHILVQLWSASWTWLAYLHVLELLLSPTGRLEKEKNR